MRASLIALGFVLTSLVTPLLSGAQQRDVERARAEFRAGVELVRQGAWADAEAAFERAYALFPEPVILFNLAAVRAERAELLQARADYREFLRHPRGSRDLVASAREALSGLETRIPRITVHVDGLEAGDEIRIGDAAAAADEPIEVDPGLLRVLVSRDGRVIGSREFEVEEASTPVLVMDVSAPPPVASVESRAGAALTDGAPEERADDALWWALGISIAAVLVGGGVATGVAVSESMSPEPPFVGSIPPGVIIASLSW